ncbi:lipopolysaccharide assembly protein LapB [Aquimarina sp. Aq107]|uniref:tetratricopeptide repeat protein n=1 Tax=Aquimarina sp. Aq107 TaxID=1191912 RepID=UPI000D560B81|nr:hypothetical protein [Aquimarina sp. Aq107]
MLKYLHFLFVLSYSMYCTSQQTDVIHVNKRIDSLNNASLKNYMKGEQKGFEIAKKAHKEAIETQYLYGIVQSRSRMSLYDLRNTEYRGSLEQLFTSINILKVLLANNDLDDDLKERYLAEMHRTYLKIFNVYRILDNYEMQFRYAKLSEEYLLKINYTQSQLIRVKAAQATVYEKLELFQKSLLMYEEVMVFYKQSNNHNVTADLYNVIAELHLKNDQLKKSEISTDSSFVYANKASNKIIIKSALLIKAKIANERQKFEKALKYIDKISDLFKQKNNDPYVNLELGKSFLGLNKSKKAEKYLNEALSLYLKENANKMVYDTANVLKQLYTKTNNISKQTQLNSLIENYDKKLLESKLSITLKEIDQLESTFLDKKYLDSLIDYDRNVFKFIKIFSILTVILLMIWIYRKKLLVN